MQLCMAHCAQVQAGLLVCDVFSGWAGPCHIMKPIITKLKAKVRTLILGLSFSISVIKLDQLAMQRGKDLVQVSPSYRRKQKESEKVEVSTFDILVLKLKFQHLIIWCACSMPQLALTIFLILSPWQISAGDPTLYFQN